MNDPELYDAEADRFVDLLLQEELGGQSPPDLSAVVMARARGASRQARRLWAVAAAACVLLAVGAWWLLAGRYPAPVATGDWQLAEGPALQRGASVQSGLKPATLELGGYSRIELQPRSRVMLAGAKAAEEIVLQQGGVACEVARQKGTFAVRTELGTVSVTGTRFTVQLVDDDQGDIPMGKHMVIRVLVGAVMVTGGWGSISVAAGEEKVVTPKGAAPAATQAPDGGKGKMPLSVTEDFAGKLDNMIADMIRECEPNDAQKAKIDEKVKAYRQAVAQWQKDNGETLATLQAAGKGDESAREQLSALHSSRAKLDADLRADLAAILTPQQQAKWEGFQLYQSLCQQFARAALTDEQKAKVRDLANAAAPEFAAADSKAARGEIRQKLSADVEALLTDAQKQAMTKKKNSDTQPAEVNPKKGSGAPPAETNTKTGTPK